MLSDSYRASPTQWAVVKLDDTKMGMVTKMRDGYFAQCQKASKLFPFGNDPNKTFRSAMRWVANVYRPKPNPK